MEARKPITDEPVQLVSLEYIAEIVMGQITLQLSVEVLKAKDHFKRQWLGKTRNEKQVKGQVNALDNSSDTDEGEQLNYFALSLDTQCESIYDVSGKSPKKLFTSLHSKK